jgi:outer membrane immunogenic protein
MKHLIAVAAILATCTTTQAQDQWTGFYAGVIGGGSAGSSHLVFTGTSPIDDYAHGSGWLGGVQVGADYQIDQFVIGAVADIAATSLATKFTDASSGGDYTGKITYLGTVRARAGVLATPATLVYAHGGLAYGNVEPSIMNAGSPATFLKNNTRAGSILGAGAEFAINESLSVQAEYSFVSLGAAGISTSAAPGNGTDQLNAHVFKTGMNFRF